MGSVYGRTFLEALLQQRPDLAIPTAAAGVVNGLRDQALARIAEMGIPTTRDEEWKYTDLSSLIQHAFSFPAGLPRLEIPTEIVSSYGWPESDQTRLVFLNGIYAPELSNTTGIPAGVSFGNLGSLAPEQAQQHLQRVASEDVFTDLNTACFQDAAILLIPRQTEISTPIHLLFVSTAASHDPTCSPLLNQPRLLIHAATGSQITLIEDYVGISEAVSFTNAVTEVIMGENAEVHHTYLQRQSPTGFHMAKTAILQHQDSRYTCNAISLGAQLSRHTLETLHRGPQASTILNGLTLASETQLTDTHSAIDHQFPYGSSRQIHKCIIDDRAHAVFNGKIRVQQQAQMTTANQANRTLLLSPKARINTKPQLEIVADNVKCSHGATVSQLEADEVFYLQSRGIDQAKARHLLTYAFASEVLDQIPLTSIQNHYRQLVLKRTEKSA